MRLKVIAGHHLAKKDIFGASDPYVRVDLNTINGDQTVDSALTRTKKKTLNPVWEEEFIFRVSGVKKERKRKFMGNSMLFSMIFFLFLFLNCMCKYILLA